MDDNVVVVVVVVVVVLGDTVDAITGRLDQTARFPSRGRLSARGGPCRALVPRKSAIQIVNLDPFHGLESRASLCVMLAAREEFQKCSCRG